MSPLIPLEFEPQVQTPQRTAVSSCNASYWSDIFLIIPSLTRRQRSHFLISPSLGPRTAHARDRPEHVIFSACLCPRTASPGNRPVVKRFDAMRLLSTRATHSSDRAIGEGFNGVVLVTLLSPWTTRTRHGSFDLIIFVAEHRHHESRDYFQTTMTTRNQEKKHTPTHVT